MRPPARAAAPGRWFLPVVSLILLAAVGVAIAAIMFARWSEVTAAGPAEAGSAFEEALKASGGGPAYLFFAADGSVGVRRDLEHPEATSLRLLHLLAWDPRRARLIRVDFPFWFVRVKLGQAAGLGAIAAILSDDWDATGLTISAEDLGRRGPGLVVDHTLANGARVVVWTE